MAPVEDEVENRLEDAGRLLTEALGRLRISKAYLAKEAGVHPRTIRRIELGQVADLASYAAVGATLGWPLDWFLHARELLDSVAGPEPGEPEAEEALRLLGLTGWFRGDSLELLRVLVYAAYEHRAEPHWFEMRTHGMRQEFRRYERSSVRR